MATRPILLVGSVPRESSEEVFRLLARELGPLAPRYPDGETGKRINWIRWQRHVFDDNPDLHLVEGRKLPGFQDTIVRPFYAVKEGTDLSRLRFKRLGYGEEAIASYQKFAELKRSGVIPAEVKFQVCLPTVVSLITVYILKEDRAKVEHALEMAMKREVDEIASAIPASELAVQWDAANEVIGHDGGIELHYDNPLDNSVDRLVRQVGFVPAGVEAGVHLCYGDPGHKHVIEPKDTRTCVAFTNGIVAKATRPVDFVHLPIPRGWDRADYYKPLTDLKVPTQTEIYLGLIHYTDGIEGTRRRLQLAAEHLADFGIATECGFGRRDPTTVHDLLKIHREAVNL